jgi:uncharacterized protein (DUF305 family)
MGGFSHGLIVKASVLAMVFVSVATSIAGTPNEIAFLAENDAAMKKMMANMQIKPSGDVDQDFATMMIPHHQGAIDMAKAELQFGHDPVLLRLAQGIIVEQQQEIDLMRRELERLAPRQQQGVVK